jgi:hypothetical protein
VCGLNVTAAMVETYMYVVLSLQSCVHGGLVSPATEKEMMNEAG